MNSYLPQQAQAITQQANNNLMNYQLPSINSGAIAAGGFGGSRQGVAQGLAIGQTNQGITNSLANLYGNAYAQDQQISSQQAMQQSQIAANQKLAEMNDATQRLGLSNSYNLGLGNLGLGQQQTQNNYSLGMGQLGLGQYNAETSRGLGYGQLQQQGDQNAFNNQLAGAGLQLQGLNALQGWNNQGVNWANQQQQTPLQNLGQLSQIGASIGGQGGTMSTPGPSTIGSALGGGLTAAQLWALLTKNGG
jgi:hypothetical protein